MIFWYNIHRYMHAYLEINDTTIKSSWFSVRFWAISRLGSAFIFLQYFKLAIHLYSSNYTPHVRRARKLSQIFKRKITLRIELFRRFIDYVIWVARSKSSNERIRQALTSIRQQLFGTYVSPSLHSQKNGWSWFPRCQSLHNYWTWFCICHKRLLKSTVKGRPFINAKSNHSNGRLPNNPWPTWRKINPLKPSFGHDKRHDSNGIKLGEKAAAPEMRKERWPTGLATSFPHLVALTEGEKT